MSAILAALIVAAVVGWSALRIVSEMRAARGEALRTRTLSILGLFTKGLSAVQDDPKALLVWQPLARTVRQLFPAECASLDGASGSVFPFSADVIAVAHARWTADWLAWEQAHDASYKLKAAVAEQDADSRAGRARLDAVEREKLELYQRRYEEYVRVGKALQRLN